MSRRAAGWCLVALVAVTGGPLARSADDEEPKVLGKTATEWIKMLRSDPEVKRRRGGLLAMELLGPAARNVLPAVQKSLKEDADETVRKEAAALLGKMHPKAKDAKLETGEIIDALVEAVQKDKSGKVRETAAMSLGRIGRDAASSVAALTTALKDKDTSVRTAAAESLGRVGPEALTAVPELAEVLRDKTADPFTRRYAAFALGQVGPENPSQVVEPLSATLAEAGAPVEVRRATAEALGKLGRDGFAAVAALADAVKDKNTDLRRTAVVALGQIGPDARAAVPALLAAARDEDRAVRAQVLHTLGVVGKEDADKVVPALLEALKDRVLDVRVGAIVSLGQLGPAAKGAIPALTNLMRGGTPAVREAAEEALKKIDPKPEPKPEADKP